MQFFVPSKIKISFLRLRGRLNNCSIKYGRTYPVFFANGDEQIVCRQAFINIHGTTPRRVTHLAHFATMSPTPPVDKRGKQPNQRAKDEDVRQQIQAHIHSFSMVESHYGRAKANKGRNSYLCHSQLL